MLLRRAPRLALLILALTACGGDDSPDAPSADAGERYDGGVISIDEAGVEVIEDDDDAGVCVFSGEREHLTLSGQHVLEPLPASAYNSSPPSSGPHCEQWGKFAIFDEGAPLSACNFVHNLEHGGVAILYNCPHGCPALVEELEELVRSHPHDPECFPPRVLLTPYAQMDSLVAASAWGYTWTSDCFDAGARASLLAFVTDHLGSNGQAPEYAICSNGSIGP